MTWLIKIEQIICKTNPNDRLNKRSYFHTTQEVSSWSIIVCTPVLPLAIYPVGDVIMTDRGFIVDNDINSIQSMVWPQTFKLPLFNNILLSYNLYYIMYDLFKPAVMIVACQVRWSDQFAVCLRLVGFKPTSPLVACLFYNYNL